MIAPRCRSWPRGIRGPCGRRQAQRGREPAHARALQHPGHPDPAHLPQRTTRGPDCRRTVTPGAAPGAARPRRADGDGISRLQPHIDPHRRARKPPSPRSSARRVAEHVRAVPHRNARALRRTGALQVRPQRSPEHALPRPPPQSAARQLSSASSTGLPRHNTTCVEGTLAKRYSPLDNSRGQFLTVPKLKPRPQQKDPSFQSQDRPACSPHPARLPARFAGPRLTRQVTLVAVQRVVLAQPLHRLGQCERHARQPLARSTPRRTLRSSIRCNCMYSGFQSSAASAAAEDRAVLPARQPGPRASASCDQLGREHAVAPAERCARRPPGLRRCAAAEHRVWLTTDQRPLHPSPSRSIRGQPRLHARRCAAHRPRAGAVTPARRVLPGRRAASSAASPLEHSLAGLLLARRSRFIQDRASTPRRGCRR